MGRLTRIGHKIRSGLTLGAKIAVGAGALYLGNKAHSQHTANQHLIDQAQRSNEFGEAISFMTPEQQDQLITERIARAEALAQQPPPLSSLPIGQQGQGGDTRDTRANRGQVMIDRAQRAVNVARASEQGKVAGIRAMFGR